MAVHLAVDLVDAGDQALLLFELLEIDGERLLAGALASDADHLVCDLLGREQQGLVRVLQRRLDGLAELPQALERVLVHGHADGADLAAIAHAFDEQDRASRAVGGGL